MSRFGQDLAEQDLTIEEFDVLIHLASAPSGEMPLRQLVGSMVLGCRFSRSGLTRLLDRMERDGLVDRSLNREDRRQFDVAITKYGGEVFDKVWPKHLEGIQRYFCNPLTDNDVRGLRSCLSKLIRANQLLGAE